LGVGKTEEVPVPEWRLPDDDEDPTIEVRGLTEGEVSNVTATALKGNKLKMGGIDRETDDFKEAMKNAESTMTLDMGAMAKAADAAKQQCVAYGLSVKDKYSVDDAKKFAPETFRNLLEAIVDLTNSKDLVDAVASFRKVDRRTDASGGDGNGSAAGS
jgi:hypothetical protein